MQGLFDFQNLNNRKATHSFVPRRLIFKLQWEVLKLYDPAWVGALQKPTRWQIFYIFLIKFWELLSSNF